MIRNLQVYVSVYMVDSYLENTYRSVMITSVAQSNAHRAIVFSIYFEILNKTIHRNTWILTISEAYRKMNIS